MINITTLKQGVAIVALTLLATTPIYAHSGHNESNLQLKWNFTQDAQNKIKNRLASSISNYSFGLSKLDQKIFRDYGIRVGNTFKSSLGGHTVLLKRTSLGVQVLNAKQISNMVGLPEVPAQNMSWISKISVQSHIGHNHEALPKVWTFAPRTADKIAAKMIHANYPVSIGLNSHERKAMKAYGIKAGNTFQSRIAGQNITVTRTTSGLTINKDNNMEVATSIQTGAM